MHHVDDWFLSAAERGNVSTTVDEGLEPGTAWTVGNSVEPLIHGVTYFSRLTDCLDGLR